MPVLKNSTYHPTLPFKNKHFNTVYRTLFPPFDSQFERRRINLKDGDFLDLDMASVKSDKVVIAVHGLEGSSESSYILSLTACLNAQNFDVIALNLRGCSGEPNRLFSSYHSAKIEDLEAVIEFTEAQYDYKDIHLIGYSLGGNLVLKYLGENGHRLPANIRSGIGVSVPCDLKATSIKMNAFSNRLYLNRFLKSLQIKAFQKLEAFPDMDLSKEAILDVKTFLDFDNLYTAPAHGFKNAEDYYNKASCKPFIPSISLPTLLITALDDPFFTPECYPFKEASSNDYFFMEAPKYGGHVGFGTYLNAKKELWAEQRILTFLTSYK